jgi:hypothetical protein
MSDQQSLQNKIEPCWTEYELKNVLHPTDNIVRSDEKVQRDKLKKAIENRAERTEDLRKLISPVVNWDNKETAIALWAGHIDKANTLRGESGNLTSPKSAEAALIERFAQPVYEEQNIAKAQLVRKLLPIVRASPISQFRPEIWSDEDQACEQIRWVLDEHVDKMGWES